MLRITGMAADTAMPTLVGHEQEKGLSKSQSIQVRQSHKAVENNHGYCLCS